MNFKKFGGEEWLNVWEKKAKLDIAQSTIEAFTLEELLKMEEDGGKGFLEQLQKTKLNYGWIEGSAEFKEEVGKLYPTISKENILSTNGATGANLLSSLSLIQPGDHVISHYPTYQQLYDLPASLGADVSYWRAKEENEWLPTIEELKELIRPNTKCIFINNAAQPTGAVMGKEFLEQVIDCAREIGAIIVSDEVYFPFDEITEYEPIANLYEKGISINSVSKTYSIPGVRVGWIATQDKRIADKIRGLRDYSMISTGVIDDLIATLVLKHREKVLQRGRKIVQTNLDTLKRWVNQEPRVSMIPPKSVSLSFVKLQSVPKDETEKFCIELLEKKGVLVIPGNRFDNPGYIRIGYCTTNEVLEEGLRRISEFLDEYGNGDY